MVQPNMRMWRRGARLGFRNKPLPESARGAFADGWTQAQIRLWERWERDAMLTAPLLCQRVIAEALKQPQ